ncbi:MAG TPA: phosphatidate cytidylyltransferase [Clostridia bacterium]|nr:phosphatidate cytidylyltransferase [Clostridia bacterium]
MKTRIISAAVAIVLLAGVMYLGSTAIGIAVFILALIGIHEFYNALEKIGFKPVYLVGYLSCLMLLYPVVSSLTESGMRAMLGGKSASAGGMNALIIGMSTLTGGNMLMIAAMLAFAMLVLLFCLMMFSNGRYSLADVAMTLLGITYIPFLFYFVTITRYTSLGYLYIWLIFIGAWATDTFAYFTGVTIGKTKILPKISPKKSLEGCIGGVLGCMLAMLLFGLYFKDVLKIPLLHFVILGLLCGVISQIGDWSASAVKRAAGIKDYGNIMPGHGGVLDRLDSILFVAPVVYFYIKLIFLG